MKPKPSSLCSVTKLTALCWVPTVSYLLKISQSSSKEIQRDSNISSGSMLGHPWHLPHSHFTSPKMSSDPPKQAGIFTCVAKGPLLCAASGHCCLWPRCLITVLSGHQPLCSLGPHKSSPRSAGVCPPTTAPGWGWTLPLHLCVLLSLTLGLCLFTRTLITAATMSLPGFPAISP